MTNSWSFWVRSHKKAVPTVEGFSFYVGGRFSVLDQQSRVLCLQAWVVGSMNWRVQIVIFYCEVSGTTPLLISKAK